MFRHGKLDALCTAEASGKRSRLKTNENGLKFGVNAGKLNVGLEANAENERATSFYIRNGFEKAGGDTFSDW